MKAGFVAASAALVGGVVAGPHQGHELFHRRGGYVDDQVCTVYTTVYVTALPSMAANSTIVVYPSPAPATSTPCEEHNSTSIYTPPPYVAPSPSKEVYTPPPYVAPSSTPCEEESTSIYTPSPSVYTPPPYVAPSSKEVYTPPAESSSVYTPPAYTPPAVSSKVYTPPKPKPSKPAHGGSGYTHNITPNGQKWAITYTPYAKNGDCKSAADVQSDIAEIAGKGYTTIRSYSTDCGVFENVVPACEKHGLKVIYGIFLDAAKPPFSSGADEQLQDIIDNAPKDSMAMLIVGNEAIFAHGVQAGELASYVKSCKEKMVAAGFTDVPVTTTEPVGTWEEYGAPLCDVIDVFAVQVHPFFDGGITAGEAGDFAKKQMEQAAKVCPEAAAKGTYISEIGWPRGGSANGAAKPGVYEQKEALAAIIAAVGEQACIFSFQNDDWKEPGAFGVEQHFGCADIL